MASLQGMLGAKAALMAAGKGGLEVRNIKSESMPGVCYQLHGDNRWVTRTQEHWREALASHQQAAHGGEDDKKCPAGAQLKRRIAGRSHS